MHLDPDLQHRLLFQPWALPPVPICYALGWINRMSLLLSYVVSVGCSGDVFNVHSPVHFVSKLQTWSGRGTGCCFVRAACLCMIRRASKPFRFISVWCTETLSHAKHLPLLAGVGKTGQPGEKGRTVPSPDTGEGGEESCPV